MEFGIEKYAMHEKRQITLDEWNWTTKSRQNVLIFSWEKETYKYWGILEADTIKQVEMKEKII